MKNIVIFASGDGSNAEAIVKHFAANDSIKVKCVLTNRINAGVHQRMESLGIPTYNFPKEVWSDANEIVRFLQKENTDFIVLAGFLAKIEIPIIKAFTGRIINIHPSLLPKYGGKGMWGHHIHEAVIAARETQSGITIHYIDEDIDKGEIIFQASCEVLPDDTPDSLAEKIHALEHRHFPSVVEKLVNGLN